MVVATAVIVALANNRPTSRRPAPRSPVNGGANRYLGTGIPSGLRLPTFALPDLRGHRVTSSGVGGHVVVITFFDSKCTTQCPLDAAAIAGALDQLSPRQRRQVRSLAISMSPRDDTIANARAFLRAHHLLGRMDYLIGTPRQLRPVWSEFHVLSSLQSGNSDLHSADIRIYERGGSWVADFDASDLNPADIAHDLRVAIGRA